MLETVTHEHYHYLQVCTSGFFYQFIIKLFTLISKCKTQPIKTWQDLPSYVPNTITDEFKNLAYLWTRPGPEGVTVHSIVESAAFLVQKRTHHLGLDPDSYMTMLDEVPEVYGQAYYVARRYLHQNAFFLLPLLSHLALCTKEPERVFSTLCSEISQSVTLEMKNISLNSVWDILLEVIKAGTSEYLGNAGEVAEKREMAKHPIYTNSVHLLNERLFPGGNIDVMKYMAKPYDLGITDTLVRPMLFNREKNQYWPLYIPDLLWSKFSEEEQQEYYDNQALVLISALSLYLFPQ